MTATPLRPAGTSIRVVMTSIVVAGTSSINVDRVNIDTCTTVDRMSRFVGAGEAARLLGIQKATLYAYVSRGLIERRVAVDGRTSLYAVDDVEALVGRGRRREVEPRPSLDVQIVTGVTTLDESGVRYLGHDVAELSRTVTYEQVAELLWTGALAADPTWPAPDGRRPGDAPVAITDAVGAGGVPALIAVASALDVRHPDRRPRRRGPPSSSASHRRSCGAKRWGGSRGPLASAARLAAAWHPDPPPELGRTLDRALVLLADHELATSTLAVRVAGSTWPGPYLGLRGRAGGDRRAVPRRRRPDGPPDAGGGRAGRRGRAS